MQNPTSYLRVAITDDFVWSTAGKEQEKRHPGQLVTVVCATSASLESLGYA